ncbi:MAG: low molecular weight phosphotyrosine protein phosphatase [Actinobacteria bacterium]|nr:MAG: low molecular weight phosphotyrosine protein phosphatase [Actinomycetota bacterium]REK39121.1 MAG: low molecular weight phosphotyrosine protein phosphatase [Actinomycetota bacterium]
MKILTVCLANICRSPAAEAAIRKAADREGLRVEVDSAGTGAWNVGQPPHPESVEAGARVGLDIRGRARKVNSADFDRFDMILAMDATNLRDLMELAPSKEARAKVRLFRTFDPSTDEEEIPDPWGGPTEGYDQTMVMVTAAADGLIETLKRQA